MKCLVDNQLPVALSKLIVSLGCDCVHVSEVGLAQATDAQIWDFAYRNERVVISKDDDFLYLAGRQPGKAGFLWVRLGNCRTAVLREAFIRLWPGILASLEAGDRIVELR